jgi:hypothetical protein
LRIGQAEQFPKAKTGIKMIPCPGRNYRAGNYRAINRIDMALGHRQGVSDRMHHQSIDPQLFLDRLGHFRKSFRRIIGVANAEDFRDFGCFLLVQAQHHVKIFLKIRNALKGAGDIIGGAFLRVS